MSGWNVVSNCPSCGAPIYVPGVWSGITPPPPTFTCVCKTYQLQKSYDLNNQNLVKVLPNLPAYINQNSENNIEELQLKINSLEKQIEELKSEMKELTFEKQTRFLKKNNKKLLRG